MLRQLKLRVALAAATVLVGSVMIVVALVFLCYGAYLLLTEYLMPGPAAFATAGIALLFLLVFALFSKIIVAMSAKKESKKLQNKTAEIGRLLGLKFTSSKPANAAMPLLIAAFVGFAMGASPRLRALALDLLGL